MKGGGGQMEIYTIKQAARHAKIGMETLKRACEEGLIKATQLPNRQWRIAESALQEAMHKGIDLRGLTRRAGKKRPQPEALRRAQQAKKKAA
jgi:excisionase family DNA binding protein